MCFFHVDASEYHARRAGVRVQAFTGQSAQLCFVRLAPGTTTDHAHANEQIGYIAGGEVEVTVGAETRVLRQGDGYLIPPHVRHAFTVAADEPVELIEIFCPPKEENDRRA